MFFPLSEKRSQQRGNGDESCLGSKTPTEVCTIDLLSPESKTSLQDDPRSYAIFRRDVIFLETKVRSRYFCPDCSRKYVRQNPKPREDATNCNEYHFPAAVRLADRHDIVLGESKSEAIS